MTNKQRFYALQAEVCEAMPPYAVEMTIRAGYGQQYGAGAHRRLSHVKQGKIADLQDLIALVERSMPEFEIPAHLLPAQPALVG